MELTTTTLKVFAAFWLAAMMIASASAAEVGHSAPAISAGTFESGNFAFPNNLTVGGNNFFVNNATGYIGIGTATPMANLHLYRLNDGGNINLTLHNPGTAVGTSASINFNTFATFGHGPSIEGIRMNAGNFDSDLAFITEGNSRAERLRITSTGKVGIGTTTPSRELDVRGIGNFSGTVYLNNNTDVLALVNSINTSSSAADDWNLSGNNLFPKSLNYRIGLGTTSPNASLEIQTNSVNGNSTIFLTENDVHGGYLRYDGTGNVLSIGRLANGVQADVISILRDSSYVGIGTKTPSAKLDVAAAYMNLSNGYSAFGDTPPATTAASQQASAFFNNFNNYAGVLIRKQADGIGDYLAIENGSNAPIFYVKSSGNVGIGTTTPSMALDVRGNGNFSGTIYLKNGTEILNYINTNIAGNSTSGDSNGTSTYVPYVGANKNTNLGIYNLTTTGMVGIGTTAPGSKLDVVGGNIRQNGYTVADAATDNLLPNGDFEMGLYGWSGLDTVVGTNYSGNQSAQRSGGSTVLSNDYIPVNPQTDVLYLEGWFMKTANGTTPGVLYFGYAAYDSAKQLITSVPCGTYCYFAANNYIMPTDGAWHKFSSTTAGEGTSYPKFPVGTKYVRVLALINYGSSVDSVTVMDHVVLKRLNYGPVFAGNNFVSNNMVDQTQYTKLYTTSSNNFIIEPPSSGKVGIGTTTPSRELDVRGIGNFSGTVYVNNGTDVLSLVTAVNTSSSTWNVSGSSIYPRDLSYNVGIGTTSTGQKLTVNGSVGITNNNAISWYNSSGSAVRTLLVSGSDNAYIGPVDAGSLTGMTYIQAGHSTVFNVNGGSGTFTEAMRIINTGNVGIGTTTPSADLEVSGSSSQVFKLNNTAGSNLILASGVSTPSITSSGALNIIATGSSKISLQSGSLERLVIDTNGNVGIGTATPSRALDVRGVGNFSGTVYINNGTDISALVAGADDWNVSGSNLFPLSTAYNVGIGTTAPGSKLDVNGSFRISGILGTIETQSGDGGVRLRLTRNGTNYIDASDALGSLSLGTGGIATNRLVIDNTGRVGIGTPSPQYELHVNNSGSATSIVATSDTVTAELRAGGSAGIIGTVSNHGLQFMTNNDIKATILGNGNVGIGTTTPSMALDVRGAGNFSGTVYVNNNTDILALVNSINTSSSTADDWNVSGTNLFPKSLAYNVGVGTVAPGAKLDVNGSGRFTSAVNVTTRVAPFYGLKVEDYADNSGVYIGSVSGGISKYISGDSYYYNSNLWRSDTTTSASINFYNGNLSFYANSGLTAGADFTPTERMRITSAGNVGIGTSTPETNLAIYSALNPTLQLRSYNLTAGSEARIDFTMSTAAWSSTAPAGGRIGVIRQGGNAVSDLYLSLNNANGILVERMRINGTNGNVGIGTSTPSQTLDVRGAGNFSGTVYVNNNTDILALVNSINTSSSAADDWNLSGSNLFPKGLDYNVGIGTNSPEQKLHVTSTVQIGGEYASGSTLSLSPSGLNGGAGIYAVNAGSYQPLTIDARNLTFRAGGSSTNVVFVSSSGNMGIGTMTPAGKLDIVSTGNNQLRLSYNSSHYGSIYVNETGSMFITTTNPLGTDSVHIRPDGNLFIGDSSTDAVYVGRTDYNILTTIRGKLSVTNSTGSQGIYQSTNATVGIGTTNPSSKFEVIGNVNVTGNISFAYGNALTNPSVAYPTVLKTGWDGSQDYTYIYTAGSTAANAAPKIALLRDGNVGIGTTTPSRALDVRGVGNFSGTVYINNGTDISTLVTGSDDWNVSGSNLFPKDLAYNLGLGTTSPTATKKLDVRGNISLGFDGTYPVTISGPANGGAIEFLSNSSVGGASNRYLRLGAIDNNKVFRPMVTLVPDSYTTGVNTTAPTSTLEVQGTFNASTTNGGMRLDSSGNVWIGI